MIIAVDFDGTCVAHDYPRIGADIGAVPYLKQLIDAGHKLILYTMRSGEELKAAEEWFAKNDIPLWGVNKNPSQWRWTKSPKIYANCYIDDTNIGCPVLFDPDLSDRPYVDWSKVIGMISDK